MHKLFYNDSEQKFYNWLKRPGTSLHVCLFKKQLCYEPDVISLPAFGPSSTHQVVGKNWNCVLPSRRHILFKNKKKLVVLQTWKRAVDSRTAV